jgi:hypothetical protein
MVAKLGDFLILKFILFKGTAQVMISSVNETSKGCNKGLQISNIRKKGCWIAMICMKSMY